MDKSADAFRTISEVAEDLDLPQHVLRFWETRFTQIKPLKRGGGRRYYRPDDVELLKAIRHLLYGEGYTIKGVQRILKEQGPRAVTLAVQQALNGGPAVASPVAAPHDDGDEPEAHVSAFEEDDPLPSVVTRPLPGREPLRPVAVKPAPVISAPPVARPSPVPAPPQRFESNPVPPPPVEGGLSASDLHRLRAALAELQECERILNACRRV